MDICSRYFFYKQLKQTIMSMKRLSAWMMTGLLFTVFSMETKAQENLITFGVKGGLNLSTFGGDVKNTKSVMRYQFGITADVALTENLYILTGLDLQTKGTKQNPKAQPAVKYNPMYLQLPVHIGYKFDIGSDIRLVVNAGPYAAYGIGGKIRSEGEKLSAFGSDRLKRLDYGIGGGVGVELRKFVIHAGYDFGLANISDAKGVKIRNRNPFLTVGYKF